VFRNKEKNFLEACEKNDTQYVNKNIGSIDKEFSDDQGQTPLFTCMRNASFDVADILIKNGFNVNTASNVKPIAATIIDNAPKALDYLIKNDADINSPLDSQSNTYPIALAIHKGFNEITNILIKNGADLSIKQQVQGGQVVDELPLISVAAQSGNLDLLEMLSENCDVNEKSKMGLLPFHFLMIKSDPEIHSFQNKAAKILLDKGAILGPSKEDKENGISSSAITYMFSTDMSDKDRIIREKLILDVFERNLADQFYVDINGNNLLKRASNMGSIKLVKQLIKLGIEVSKPDNEGYTSLHNAACLPDYGVSYRIIDELVKHPQDLNLKTNEGYTAVEMAFNKINYDGAMTMIEAGSDIPANAHIEQNDQVMPLWVQLVSHIRNQEDVQRLLDLIKRGLDIRQTTYETDSGKKSELNILGVFLSRAILESELEINERWHGFLDENNRLHQLLDYEEIVNFLIQKHKEQPFEDIRIHKNSYETEEMIKIIKDKKILKIK